MTGRLKMTAMMLSVIFLESFCLSCGLAHLKRTDIAERVDFPVASTPASIEVFGTVEANESDEKSVSPSSAKPKVPNKPKPFGPATPGEIDMADAAGDSGLSGMPELDPTQLGPSEPVDPTTEILEPTVAPTDETIFEIPVEEAEEPEIEEFGFDWQRVLITEVVTDPQQDHNGSGSVSASDEYVEIFNGTPEFLDVSAWQLNMRDGTDETMFISQETSDLFFSAGGDPAFFQSGEIMVMGNPRGTMNNAIELDLIDESGVMVDSITVDDANATGLADEAYFLDEEGIWEMGLATPGELLW